MDTCRRPPYARRPPAKDSFALLRRHGATARDVADSAVLDADAIVHVTSPRAEIVAEFRAEAPRLLAPAARARVLAGQVRPKNYTGAAMDRWAYARGRPAAGRRHAQRVLRPAQQDRGVVGQGLDGASHFHRVCAALRDVARNPEWTFVREGPTWHGRRVAGWDELLG